jgi:hypothetical protein
LTVRAVAAGGGPIEPKDDAETRRSRRIAAPAPFFCVPAVSWVLFRGHSLSVFGLEYAGMTAGLLCGPSHTGTRRIGVGVQW